MSSNDASALSGSGSSSIEPEQIESSDRFDARLRELTSRIFAQKQQEIEQSIDSPGLIEKTLNSALDWSERFANKLQPGAFTSLSTVFRMLSSVVSGEYKGFSKSTLVYLTAALVYCVSPIDAIPDAIPGVGLLDDAFVVAWTLKQIVGELQTFRAWERLKASSSALISYLPYFADVKRIVFCPGWMTENESGDKLTELLAPIFPNATFDYYHWRSNVSWSQARDYVDGDEGSEAFEEYLRDRSAPLENVSVFAHSLGARLAVRTLARMSREPVKRALFGYRKPARLAQTFLMGAAIDADDPDLQAAAQSVNAPVCNFFNRADRVLSYLYRAAEQRAPLGLSGFASPNEKLVDCVVSGREEYWLDFASNVATTLSFLRSSSLLTKFSLAEALASETPQYWNHQFLLYARFFRDSVMTKDEAEEQERDESENERRA